MESVQAKNKAVAAELKNFAKIEPKEHVESISNKQASSAALRGGGLRADEQFLATIPGAGAAL